MLLLKYVEFKKYILHVKLIVYYTVSCTCNVHFLNSTYFIINQFKSIKFSSFFCCWVYLDGGGPANSVDPVQNDLDLPSLPFRQHTHTSTDSKFRVFKF